MIVDRDRPRNARRDRRRGPSRGAAGWGIVGVVRSRAPAGKEQAGMADREPLTVRDLAGLAAIAAEQGDPRALFAAADALAKRTIGHKLFTVMRVHEAVQ